MAAFGILAALRERDRSGEGQVVDVSMADGALSLAGDGRRARARRRARRRARGRDVLAGGVVCYRPYECADGWVTLGALEPKFWRSWCRGVGREDLIEKQFERAGLRGARAGRRRSSLERTRAEWQAFAAEHDCCLEPVLDLDEALDSELVRAREMVVEIDQPGAAEPVRLLGVPVKLSAHPGRPGARARARRSASTPPRCCAEAGFGDEEIAALRGGRRRRRPAAGRGPWQRSWRERTPTAS